MNTCRQIYICMERVASSFLARGWSGANFDQVCVCVYIYIYTYKYI